MGSGRWRNLIRLGLLAAGIYLWYGGRLGPPVCRFRQVGERLLPDGYLHIALAAEGTATPRNLRRQIDRISQRYEGVPRLRVEVFGGQPRELRRAFRREDTAFLLQRQLAIYERTGTEELFIDTHRVGEAERVPLRDLSPAARAQG